MDHLTRLLLDAQAGDRDALEQFVAATHRDVLELCRYLGDRDNADDLAQETYQRAVSSLHRYRATGPARHWLLTIARRTCADAARRRSRRRRLRQRVAELSVDEHTVPAPVTERPEIDELLHELDDDRRAAFVLTQLHGFRYDEAAEMLGVPIGTIRSRVARARDQLVSALHADDADAAADADTDVEREPPDSLRRPG
jgi:RNA polymerase sigma-70 factor (ECF subfamily)